jgi:hypothetical protein
MEDLSLMSTIYPHRGVGRGLYVVEDGNAIGLECKMDSTTKAEV